MIHRKNHFDHPIKRYIRTYESIQEITTGQGDDYTTGCLLHYNCFKKHKLIQTDLSKQQALDTNPKEIQQINFTGNIDGNNNTLFFIIEEVAENILDFLEGTAEVLWTSSYDLATACSTIILLYFVLIWYQYKITQYNTLNVNLSNLQLNKLKPGIKNNTKVTLKSSSNIFGDSNNDNNFHHNSLLTNTQVSSFVKHLQVFLQLI